MTSGSHLPSAIPRSDEAICGSGGPEHSADCVIWYKRSADLIKQVALGKLRPLIGPINGGGVHARLYE
jgi:hypothetical protein